VRVAAGLLRVDDFRPATGEGLRVVVVDSGVHETHPHIGRVAGGIGVSPSGELTADYVDRLGHGTAVAAAILEKAPGAEIFVARVFDRRLDTTVEALIAAIRWGVERRADLVNLSLGTATASHADVLQATVREATAAGVWVVAAGEQEGIRWLPGSLDEVVAVTLDWTLPREACVVARRAEGLPTARASGYPRPIPGVPPERNLKGLSFAVANATGLLALALQASRSEVRSQKSEVRSDNH
jgi:subtilisin family serine protease